MKILAGLKSVLLLSRLYTQTSFLAIHCPYYWHRCRVHKGGTESDKSSFYVVNTGEVGWRDLKNSPLASDEKILELGWCDWCFTAEKSVPVRSEEFISCFWWKNTKYASWAGVTDALQQRSRYQCALMKNAALKGNSLYIQCWKLRRLKFSVICICSSRRPYAVEDVSMVTVAGMLQMVHSNKRHG